MFAQDGQATVEFLTAASLLVGFLLVYSLMGKLMQVRMKAVAAANHVMWARQKGMSTDQEAELSAEVAARFFATSVNGGANVLGQAPWRTARGSRLVSASGVTVDVRAREDGLLAEAGSVSRSLGLEGRGMQVVQVRVRLDHLEEYEGLPAGLTLSESIAGLSGGWEASGPAEIAGRLGRSTRLYPYPHGQDRVVSTVNDVLRLLFGEVRADTDLVRPDAVPADRLVRNE